jgi:hypothetical protein
LDELRNCFCAAIVVEIISASGRGAVADWYNFKPLVELGLMLALNGLVAKTSGAVLVIVAGAVRAVETGLEGNDGGVKWKIDGLTWKVKMSSWAWSDCVVCCWLRYLSSCSLVGLWSGFMDISKEIQKMQVFRKKNLLIWETLLVRMEIWFLFKWMKNSNYDDGSERWRLRWWNLESYEVSCDVVWYWATW